MIDLQEWERQLQQRLAEVRHNSQKLATAAARVRGRGEVHGVTVEVAANGDITNLQISPGAMRWTSDQLTRALLDCHHKARADAKVKVERLVHESDPGVRDHLLRLQGVPAAPEPQHQPMTEEEIQAADDAYFERMNRGGWMDNHW
jgi:hypothetical protein